MAGQVRFSAIRKRLEQAGYALVRISGSHHIFEKPGQTLLSIPVHRGKVKPYYARQVERIAKAEEPADREQED